MLDILARLKTSTFGIQEFHDGMAAAVSISGSTTDPFEISHGLKQECLGTYLVHSLSGSTTVYNVRAS